MIYNTDSKYFKEFFIIYIYNISMLFYQNIGSVVTFSINVLLVIWFLSLKLNKWGISRTLSFLMCIFIPTSFISVIGTGYGQFPLSWFHLITIILVVIALISRLKKSFFLVSPIFMIIYGLASLLGSTIISDALKQFLTVMFFLLSFFIGEYLSRFVNRKYLDKLKSYYLIGVVSFSSIVILQKILSGFNIFVGYQAVIGTGRVVYAGVMNDYSFATLYIATGAIIIMVDYFKSKKQNFFSTIFLVVLFTLSMLTVNSRTGLVAFAMAGFIYLISISLKGNWKSVVVIIFSLISLPYFVNIVEESRAGQSLFDGSGRIELLIGTIDNFSYHPFFGVGFGLENLYLETGLHVPHNIIAQYLIQLGIVGSAIFFINFFVFFYKYFDFKDTYSWAILVTLIGAMFIPDIVSSRFLSFLIILCILSCGIMQKEKGVCSINGHA